MPQNSVKAAASQNRHVNQSMWEPSRHRLELRRMEQSLEKQVPRKQRPQPALFPLPTAPVLGLHPLQGYWLVLIYSHATSPRWKQVEGTSLSLARAPGEGTIQLNWQTRMPSEEKAGDVWPCLPGATPHLLRAGLSIGYTSTLGRAPSDVAESCRVYSRSMSLHPLCVDPTLHGSRGGPASSELAYFDPVDTVNL